MSRMGGSQEIKCRNKILILQHLCADVSSLRSFGLSVAPRLPSLRRLDPGVWLWLLAGQLNMGCIRKLDNRTKI